MNPRPLTPAETRSLGLIERKPGETLHDYLVRREWEMSDRIWLLQADRDAQEAIFFSEQARWRRQMLLLAGGEAWFAAAVYLLLDHCGIVDGLRASLVAGIIALCALGGGALLLRFASRGGEIATWLIGKRRRDDGDPLTDCEGTDQADSLARWRRLP
ncbi:hypothetical protein L6Q21_09995 [Sandaracinobacter sp. RS1-74]|uniref:hypothetical protein n=1 Tax=Sandaracinobacteroides sayramensis TaxID=2913411 RepID=UPI001EDB57F0|nr:hypothetical protein [Sandaracinobacteroides sayramensis]MCG2841312.1 hypothetical protein [Sandaracinobacteroides sayramensis]